MPETRRPRPFPNAAAATALAGLLLAGTVPALAAEAPAAAPKKPAAAQRGSGAALKAYVDPRTGQLLTAPPEGEAAAPMTVQEAIEPVVEERLPNGAVKARVPRRLMHFMTASVAPDGGVATACAPGHAHGETAPRKETAREK